MPSKTFRCPECGYSVAVNDGLTKHAGDLFGLIGCLNTDEHEDGEPLVMHHQGDFE